jgi:hypothetical protein
MFAQGTSNRRQARRAAAGFNKIAAGNSRCATSFVSHQFHKVIRSGASRLPAAVPELGR